MEVAGTVTGVSARVENRSNNKDVHAMYIE